MYKQRNTTHHKCKSWQTFLRHFCSLTETPLVLCPAGNSASCGLTRIYISSSSRMHFSFGQGHHCLPSPGQSCVNPVNLCVPLIPLLCSLLDLTPTTCSPFHLHQSFRLARTDFCKADGSNCFIRLTRLQSGHSLHCDLCAFLKCRLDGVLPASNLLEASCSLQQNSKKVAIWLPFFHSPGWVLPSRLIEYAGLGARPAEPPLHAFALPASSSETTPVPQFTRLSRNHPTRVGGCFLSQEALPESAALPRSHNNLCNNYRILLKWQVYLPFKLMGKT